MKAESRELGSYDKQLLPVVGKLLSPKLRQGQ